MNLFSGLKGRQIMQVCNRCGGMLQTDTPRDVYAGGVYHVYCGWKLRKQHAEQEAVRNISADKGVPHADTLPERGGGHTGVSSSGDARGAPNPQSDVQGKPTPLHWTSHQ